MNDFVYVDLFANERLKFWKFYNSLILLVKCFGVNFWFWFVFKSDVLCSNGFSSMIFGLLVGIRLVKWVLRCKIKSKCVFDFSEGFSSGCEFSS